MKRKHLIAKATGETRRAMQEPDGNQPPSLPDSARSVDRRSFLRTSLLTIGAFSVVGMGRIASADDNCITPYSWPFDNCDPNSSDKDVCGQQFVNGGFSAGHRRRSAKEIENIRPRRS